MKLGVCVPYRNRELHLHEFVPKVGKYLKNQGIDFCMYFAHQVDDKLFNRGATKNIAAKHAFEDGCDYIVWHDIDMIPEEDGGADYSFPIEGPRHIATKISQMDYQLKYHEYFGGAVLFSKKHIEQTNGYSNGYWDWGMEDDDLFWRCHREGLTKDTNLYDNPVDLKYFKFNGDSSYLKVPFKREYRGFNSRSHTLSILCKAEQQYDKLQVYLIGDKSTKYKEFPVFRIPGYDYGVSFNNSRALSLTYWNTFNDHNYMWVKRYDKYWSWLTAVFDHNEQLSHLYLNGVEVDSKGGYGSPSPFKWNGKLKNYSKNDFYIGTSPSEPDNSPVKFFKGEVSKILGWKRALSPKEVANLHNILPEDELIFNINPDTPSTEIYNVDTEIGQSTVTIPNSILPHRVDGRFRCLPHPDEGIVDNKFVKGETTAANERRYVLGMQEGKINHKEDGIKQLNYELVSIEQLTPWAKMLNIKL